jgi:hypothetical protein
VSPAEIFELDQRLRISLPDRFHKLVHQFHVGRSVDPALRQADVEGIFKKRLIVRPDIDRDRQTVRRIDAGTGSVECKFTDRNPHPVRSQIPEPKYPFAIGHHNDGDVIVGPVL